MGLCGCNLNTHWQKWRQTKRFSNRSNEVQRKYSKKELCGLHCRWNTCHQNVDRINETKHLPGACEKTFAMVIICSKGVPASDINVSLIQPIN